MNISNLKREVSILQKALKLDTTNLRFSTWGEFNESYLNVLPEEEQKQYWHLTLKFLLIHEDIQHGNRQTCHNYTPEYNEKLEKCLEELAHRSYHPDSYR